MLKYGPEYSIEVSPLYFLKNTEIFRISIYFDHNCSFEFYFHVLVKKSFIRNLELPSHKNRSLRWRPTFTTLITKWPLPRRGRFDMTLWLTCTLLVTWHRKLLQSYIWVVLRVLLGIMRYVPVSCI